MKRYSTKGQNSLSDSLMREFCPPLDFALIAALLVDIELDADGRRTSPTQTQIDQLRATLRELSRQADECQLSELSQSRLTISPTDDSASGSSILDFPFTQTEASSSRTSECSTTSSDSMASLLDFLQTALPEIPVQQIQDVLTQAELENDEPDLWNIISNILSEEATRELLERGSEALDNDDMLSSIPCDKDACQAGPSKTQKHNTKSTTKSKRKHKFALLDVRQHHQLTPSPTTPSSSSKSSSSDIDRWTMVVSLSEQLSDLLRSHPAAHFQSYFHSPKYSTPYEALRSALKAIPDTRSELDAEDEAVFFNLLDILIPEYQGVLDSEKQSNLHSDVELAVSATRGHAEDALDLVRILRDLDSDSNTRRMEMGIYHSPVPTTPYPTTPVTPLRYNVHVPTGPPSPPAPPDKRRPPLANGDSGQRSTESAWQTVCRKQNNQPTTSINGSVAEFYKRKKENLRRRNELLQAASKLFRKKNAKSRGSEAAMVLVERARMYQRLAEKEALDAARMKVQAKRRASTEKDTIDLHGTTVAEAIVIVQEELENTTYSPSRPLKIITGRGSHSVNKQSVLKPSVRKFLDENGWFVSVWEGGLTLKGRKPNS